MPYQRILVPLDSTGPAQRGLQEALSLARRLDATLVLLHVIEPMLVLPDLGSAGTWEALREGQQASGRTLLEAAHELVRAAGVASEAVLDDAGGQRVADAIIESARAHHCDLIVMGTHGRRGVRRALLGSDAELVLRLSPVPVLLVRSAGSAAAASGG